MFHSLRISVGKGLFLLLYVSKSRLTAESAFYSIGQGYSRVRVRVRGRGRQFRNEVNNKEHQSKLLCSKSITSISF